jgi:hypothetical protein
MGKKIWLDLLSGIPAVLCDFSRDGLSAANCQPNHWSGFGF